MIGKKIRRVGVKVGSELIVKRNGMLNTRLIAEIARQCVELIDEGCEVFILTSGAINSVPSEFDFRDNERASIGQAHLIEAYRKCFEMYDIGVAQFLVSYHDLKSEKSTVIKVINEILRVQRLPNERVGAFFRRNVPIINYNDTVDNAEVRKMNEFADNDNLLRQKCILLKADMAIIAFGQDGLLNSMKQVKRTVDLEDKELVYSYIKQGSELGFGKNGMRTKVDASFTMAEHGITVVLAPGNAKDFIIRSVLGEKDFGTVFLPK